MDIVGLLISVISGAVGGNIAGAAMQDKSLGTLGNSIARPRTWARRPSPRKPS